MAVACIILLVVGTTLMVHGVIGSISCKKDKKPRNKVHFYMARNKNGILNLYLNKPLRNKPCGYWYQHEYDADNDDYIWKAARISSCEYISYLGLNPEDFKNLKWEDEPVEVFLNLED